MTENNLPTPDHGNNQARLPMWVVLPVVALAIGILVIAGAGMVDKTAGPLNTGDPIPEFSLTTFDGQVVNSADLQGKVVLINFWASWCTTCADEAAALQQTWQQYAGSADVVFIGVDYVDTEREARAYLQQYGITYLNGPDLGTRISHLFRVTGVPETYIFDRQGKLAAFLIGPFENAAEIRAVLEKIMQ